MHSHPLSQQKLALRFLWKNIHVAHLPSMKGFEKRPGGAIVAHTMGVLTLAVHAVFVFVAFQDSTSSRLLPGSSYNCCIRNLHAFVHK
jgi:hypothetical protein